MTNEDLLRAVFHKVSGMSAEAFDLSQGCWRSKSFKKGELFNNYKNVCKELGFIVEGTFRSYIIDPNTGEEQNVFFFSKNGFVTAYKSFVNQIPCEYYTEALTEAHIICINILDLQKLYQQSHEWECFGCLAAERAATSVIERVESFLLKSVEQRYVELIEAHPDLYEKVPLYHISSYLGIQGPSLSRIRKRLAQQ
ncbi:MAG: Crp/Fnr family transcriptional regulator [Bacteroidota bacterium]